MNINEEGKYCNHNLAPGEYPTSGSLQLCQNGYNNTLFLLIKKSFYFGLRVLNDRLLNLRLIYDNLRSQKKTSCSVLSMLSSISQRPHVIRWLFPFDVAKVQHFRGALSVSVRFSPQRRRYLRWSTQVSASGNAGICEGLWRYLRWGMKIISVTAWQYIIYDFHARGN